MAVAGAGAAVAAGNVATLQGYILTNPVPGWSADPQAVQNGPPVQIFADLVRQTDESISMAAAAWAGRKPASQYLFITLIQYPGSSVPVSVNILPQLNRFCSGTGGGSPSPLPGVPSSAEVACPGAGPIISAAWEQGNIVAFLVSEGLSASSIDSIAKAQAAKLPRSGGGGPGSSSGLDIGIGVGGLAVVVVAVVAALWYFRRRSRAKALSPAAAGDQLSPDPAPPQPDPSPPLSRSGFRLVAKGLRLQLGERQLLDTVDLEVPPAGLVAITGPSGEGKTVLLKVLSGLLQPDAGRVELLPVGAAGSPEDRGMNDKDRRRRGGPRRGAAVIGYISQTFDLVPFLTAAENVGLPLQVHRVASDLVHERAQGALDSVGMGRVADRMVTELSGGQRQRVAIARALAVGPDVLIVDEPTTELDPENRNRVVRLLYDLAEKGCAVVLSTHDPDVIATCTAVYLLENGSLGPSE